MSLVFALFTVLSIFLQNNVQCAPSNAALEPPADLNTKIVGGTYVADIINFNYQASLREIFSDGFALCGASIIGKTHLLTAAHCVCDNKGDVKSVKNYQVGAGSVRLEEGGSITRKPSHFFVHENYKSGDGFVYDVAVVRISSAFEFSNAIQPIALQFTTPTPNSWAWVSGWGTTLSSSNVISQLLIYVEVPVVAMSSCNQSYEGGLRPGQFCAGIVGKDSCQGDSGGPLVSLESGNLTGVVSFGFGCGSPGYPGVYQDVAYYNKWIVDQLGRSSANFITPLSALVLTLGTLLFRQI